nr:calcineurin phosphoesterase C-terminal domain protein [uncultured Gammaproteobacteria bacterium]
MTLTARGEPLKVLQLSDCHLREQPGQLLMGVDTEQSLLDVLAHLERCALWPPDLILLTGDLVQDPSASAYERLLCHLESLHLPWVALPGNHDDPEWMARILGRSQILHCAKRILTPSWQILCLNSHLPGSPAGYLNAGELEFLTQSLKHGPDLPALVAVHHPPLSICSAWMDTMALVNGEELLRLLERFPKVKGVVFGHVHQVVASRYGSIGLWSAPSTCFQFQPGAPSFALDPSPAGWRWLELHADGQIQTWVERLDHLPPGLDVALPGY